MTNLDQVREFHRVFGGAQSDKPLTFGAYSDNAAFQEIHRLDLKKAYHFVRARAMARVDEYLPLRSLRIRLLIEEFFEYLEAELNGDIVEIADGLADMKYIIEGTNV